MRAAVCHCGTTRERALELAASAAAGPVGLAAGGPTGARAAMPRDVRVLLGAAALLLAVGLVWTVFAPPPRDATTPVLGWVDPGPPDPAEVLARKAPPQPPFNLPWWK